MSAAATRLLSLLPAVYRRRDGDDGPLGELLGLAGEQLELLEQSLEQLYDDQFVETCAPWALPYIGDLLGIEGLPPAPLASRAEVAHTIAYRRRKGTAAVLEQLAGDIAGLPARAVELFELIAATQNLNHLRIGASPGSPAGASQARCQGFIELRDAGRLEQLGGPFERLGDLPSLTHAVDVRRIGSGRGRYGIASLGIFLWRLRAFRLHASPATPDAAGDGRRFRFSPLGADMPLFNSPETEDELSHLAEPRNVPEPISRRAAAADPGQLERSFEIEVDGGRVAAAELAICDLSEWAAPVGRVAVDPLLGRIALPAPAPRAPRVTFHYGFAAGIGGGEYPRALAGATAGTHVIRAERKPGGIGAALGALPAAGGVVEIGDSGRYEESGLAIAARGRRVVLRAAVGARPTVVLDGGLEIEGDPDGVVVIDGLLLTGGGVEVRLGAAEESLGSLEIAHTTLVPGIELGADGAPLRSEPSLRVGAGTAVSIAASIVGAIEAVRDAGVRIADSIVDATDRTRIAYDDGEGSYGAALSLEGTTVIGRVRADALELVSNAILLAAAPAGTEPGEWAGPVVVRRAQEGCLRFSSVPAGSRTPRRFRCPSAEAFGEAAGVPVLSSARYGAPDYCQLDPASSVRIREGADDGGELGAFHHLHLPRREAHLRTRLEEHVRFGLEAGVIHAT